MEDHAATRKVLLSRRLGLVAELSALTAEAQRSNQKLAGAEMDALRLELEIGRTGASEQLVQDLHEARSRAATAMVERTDCDERIAALEDDVANVDRMLAATVGN